jgi:cytoskeletal protein CcmA (bactofilin family)
MVRPTSSESALGAGTRVTGRVSGQGGLRIEGNVRGDVQVSGEAEVAPGAGVEGSFQAETVEVAGSVMGDIHARGPIAVRSGALVHGELRGSEVSIEPGSRVSVRLDTEFELDLGASKRR